MTIDTFPVKGKVIEDAPTYIVINVTHGNSCVIADTSPFNVYFILTCIHCEIIALSIKIVYLHNNLNYNRIFTRLMYIFILIHTYRIGRRAKSYVFAFQFNEF